MKKSIKGRVIAVLIGLLFLAGCAWFVYEKITGNDMSLNSSWSIIIIAIGVLSLISDGGRIFGFCLALFGTGILLKANWFSEALQNISIGEMAIACGLLMIGLGIIFGTVCHSRRKVVINGKDCKEASAVFNSRSLDFADKEFTGIDINGVFGSVELDLRSAIINGDQTVNVDSIFGSVVIYTGDNANYTIGGDRVFGQISDSKKREINPELPTVNVITNSVFGKVELK